MKTNGRIETEKMTVSRVRREMDQPRLTESVRKSLSAHTAPAEEKRLPILRERESCSLSAL